MAEINFSCWHCGQNIVADVEAAGLKADCPGCGRSLVIPAPEAGESPWAAPESMGFPSQGGEVGAEGVGAERRRLADMAAELGYVREQWEAAQEQCQRMGVERGRWMVECRAYRNERLMLRAELARKRKQLMEWEEEMGLGREKGEERERQWVAFEKDALFELEAARAGEVEARGELGRMEGRVVELEKELEGGHSLRGSGEDCERPMESELEVAQRREVWMREMQRVLLDTGTEAVDTVVAMVRGALGEVDVGLRLAHAEVRLLREDEARREKERERLERALAECHQGMVLAEERARAASPEGLVRDNALLRALVDRQRRQVEEQGAELQRLRRGRHLWMSVNVLAALVMVGLAVLVYQMLAGVLG